jgi:hypothetical protein
VVVVKYLTEYLQDFRQRGAERLAHEVTHPVLVLSGVTGLLRDETGGEPGREGAVTTVTEPKDTFAPTRLVGRVFPIAKADPSAGPIEVGRGSENDVAIVDHSISDRHCNFVVGVDIQLVDCGSTNGTLVAGRPVMVGHPVILHGGETVVLGRLAFVFMQPEGFLEYLARLSD